MFKLLVLSVVVAAAVAGPLAADKPVTADGCVSWDDKINALLFKPIQDALKEKQSEYIQVSNEKLEIMGFGVEWNNGKAGNFSSLQLNADGASAASQLCTAGDLKTLSINVGFGDLRATFQKLTVFTPFFDFGAPMVLSLNGENLMVSVSAFTDSKTKACTAKLDQFLFNKWGNLQLDLGDGWLNMLYSRIFNNFVSSHVVALLETFGVGDKINGFAVQFLTPVLSSYSDIICKGLDSSL